MERIRVCFFLIRDSPHACRHDKDLDGPKIQSNPWSDLEVTKNWITPKKEGWPLQSTPTENYTRIESRWIGASHPKVPWRFDFRGHDIFQD